MTNRPARINQSEVARIIRAARREGLRIAGIRPDGTIIVYDQGENPLVPVDEGKSATEDADALRWRDGDG
jgi:hypothetical protein